MIQLVDKKIVIFSHSRSGSSSLFYLLNTHPGVNLLGEPFNPYREKWAPDKKNYVNDVKSATDLDLALADIYKEHNGFKTLTAQMPVSLNEHLLSSLGENDKIILLHRKNLLQTAVSISISEQTGEWENAKLIKERVQNGCLKPIDIEELKGFMRVASKVGTYYRDFLLGNQQSFYEVTYEDLYLSTKERRVELVDEIFNFLELPLPYFNLDLFFSKRKITNSFETYKHIPNLDEIIVEFKDEEQKVGKLF